VTDPSPSPASTPRDPGAPGPSAAVARVELSVGGMHCGSCSALVTETLSDRPGVRSASVDLDAARAVVEYDPALADVDDLRDAVTEAGYTATLVG